MFFTALIKGEALAARWREVVASHAKRLELHAHFECLPLEAGQVARCAWIAPAAGVTSCVEPTEDGFALWTTSVGVYPSALGNAVQIQLSRSGEARLIAPVASPESLYHFQRGDAWIVSNDLRLCMQLVEPSLDERAVYALLQFGAVPGALTLLRAVARVPPGHAVTLGSGGVRTERRAQGFPLPSSLEPAEALARTRRAMDDVLSHATSAHAVYFSGGVDSAVLTARLVDLGRTNLKLVNYSFGPEDEESLLAERLAAHLGLTIRRVTFDLAQVAPMVERIGLDYGCPFGDYSTIPMNLLVTGSIPLMGGSACVIDGTGADGAFGLGVPMHSKHARLQMLYAMPTIVRKLMGSLYDKLRVWRFNSSLSNPFHFAKRGATMPLMCSAVVAQNTLHGSAYAFSDATRRAIHDEILDGVLPLIPSQRFEDRTSFLDLVHVCAGEFAAKNFDPLCRLGVRAVYPFLEPPLLSLGLALPWEVKCRGGERKWLLKELLAERVPREMVYRRKSGFAPPIQTIMAYPPVHALMRDLVANRRNPLREFVNRKVLDDMLDRVRMRRPMQSKVYNFLWVLVHASAWVDAQLSAGRQ